MIPDGFASLPSEWPTLSRCDGYNAGTTVEDERFSMTAQPSDLPSVLTADS
jgi:hypothetical protein